MKIQNSHPRIASFLAILLLHTFVVEGLHFLLLAHNPVCGHPDEVHFHQNIQNHSCDDFHFTHLDYDIPKPFKEEVLFVWITKVVLPVVSDEIIQPVLNFSALLRAPPYSYSFIGSKV